MQSVFRRSRDLGVLVGGASQAAPDIPSALAKRLGPFEYVHGQERLQLVPKRYQGLTPVLDSFDDLAFPGWNLREAMAFGEHFERLRRADQKARAGAQETQALLRFLPGPLPRAQLAEAFGISEERVRDLAKKKGFWLNRRKGQQPYEQLILQKLGPEVGQAYLDEVDAETAAQQELLAIEFKPHIVEVGQHLGPEGAGWTVVAPPVRALLKGRGLVWWAEVECACPGCRSNRTPIRPVNNLQRSKATRCRYCDAPRYYLQEPERDLAWEEAHIPLVLRQPALQFSYPMRAQQSLRHLNAEIRNAKSPQPPPHTLNLPNDLDDEYAF